MSVIEVFADVSCPFTHVGLRRFVAERARRGRDDVTLWVRAWPLEVVNGEPLDAGFIAEEVDDLRRQIAPDLFGGFTEAAFPASSMPALTLAAASAAVDPATGERVSLALRDLLFEQGVDIADRDVLSTLATQHAVTVDLDDPTAVLAEHRRGVELGVIGSPHFFTATGGFFCPALDVTRDADGHLQISADGAGFEAFMDACFD